MPIDRCPFCGRGSERTDMTERSVVGITCRCVEVISDDYDTAWLHHEADRSLRPGECNHAVRFLVPTLLRLGRGTGPADPITKGEVDEIDRLAP